MRGSPHSITAASPMLQAYAEECQEAERENYERERYIALFDGDERMAQVQRMLDTFPAFHDWAMQAVHEISAMFTAGVFDGIRPGHIRFRPPRRATVGRIDAR